MSRTINAPGPEKWIICEDGDEYCGRFRRFLPRFEYLRASSAGAILDLSAAHAVSGIILDMDFRRADDLDLVDEHGQSTAPLPTARRRELVPRQGLLILRHLRAQGLNLRAILCADLEDQEHIAYLQSTLHPLHIAPSNTGMDQFAAWMSPPR